MMTRVVSIIVAADDTQLSGPFTLFLQGATESCLLQDSKRKRTRLNPSRDTRSVCCSEPTRVLSKDRNVHERNPRPQICKRPCSQFNLSPIFNIPFFQKYNHDVIRPAYELRVINHWFKKKQTMMWWKLHFFYLTWRSLTKSSSFHPTTFAQGIDGSQWTNSKESGVVKTESQIGLTNIITWFTAHGFGSRLFHPPLLCVLNWLVAAAAK